MNLHMEFPLRGREYDLRDWTVAYPHGGTLTARPGLRVYLRRVGFAVAIAALPVALITRSLPERYERLLLWIGGTLGALALLRAFAAMMKSIRIERRDDRLVIVKYTPWPRKREYPISTLLGLQILEEDAGRAFGRHWRVMVLTKAEVVQFILASRTRRDEATGLPEEVGWFVAHLQHATGLSCAPPQRADLRAGRSVGVNLGTTHSSKTYDALEEMPPDLRREVEERMAEMLQRGVSSATFQRYTVLDSNGRAATYDSLDEMPPDVRERFEEARRQGPHQF